jgi:hypothetical protein
MNAFFIAWLLAAAAAAAPGGRKRFSTFLKNAGGNEQNRISQDIGQEKGSWSPFVAPLAH